jgi:putative aminopeptidase FrvX
MNNNLVKNLEKLCNQPGISEFEKESGIADFLFGIAKKINNETSFDSDGNIISIVEGGEKTIILEAHMDEAGFVVESVGNNVSLCPQGVIRGGKVIGDEVFVLGKNIKGKIAADKAENFILDLFQKEDIEKIKAGDLIAFKRSFAREGNLVKASALDNRIGCTVLLEVLENAVKNGTKNRLVFVFSSREEIDESSFRSLLALHRKAFAVVVDAAYAQPVDFDVDAPVVSIPVLGEGCALQTTGKGFVVAGDTIQEIEMMAKKCHIKIQKEAAPQGMGKTNLAQMLRQGVEKGAVVNVPVRDQHKQTAIMDLSDAKEAVALLSELVRKMSF